MTDLSVNDGNANMPQPEYRLQSDWGTPPSHLYYVDAPSVAVDSKDNVHVLGRGPCPIIVYGPDGGFVRAWGNGIFTMPHGLYIDGQDRVYCTDRMDNTVRIFDIEGRLLHVLGVPNGSSETGYVVGGPVLRSAGPFNGPTNVAVNPEGRIYVTDGYGNARVHVFDPAGKHLFAWGDPGREVGQFHLPHGIAIDEAGLVYVADRENSRVQIFSPEGQFIHQWRHFDRPADLYIDRQGLVYIAELGHLISTSKSAMESFGAEARGGRVSVCKLDGDVVHRFGGRDGAAAGALRSPHGISADSAGNVYVGEVNWGTGILLGLIPGDTPVVQKFTLS